MYWVYILTNRTNTTLYVGITNDLVRRIAEHKQGSGSRFTSKYKLTKLVHRESAMKPYDAIRREKQIKGWSRKKKEDLINESNPTWRDLGLDLSLRSR